MPLTTMTKPALTCGICGGIGSGKSFIAGQFQSMGAAVFDADRAGHQVLFNEDVKAQLVERWGLGILNEQAEINRSGVAELVFADTPQGASDREFLQSLSHPLIERELNCFLASAESNIIIVDAALLFETGWQDLCTQIVYVYADEATRLKRCQLRGWDEDEFRSREAAQWSLERKRSHSDFVIENNGDTETTSRELQQVWQALSMQASLQEKEVRV